MSSSVSEKTLMASFFFFRNNTNVKLQIITDIAGEIKNIQIVLGFANPMMIMGFKVLRASLTMFRKERFSKNHF